MERNSLFDLSSLHSSQALLPCTVLALAGSHSTSPMNEFLTKILQLDRSTAGMDRIEQRTSVRACVRHNTPLLRFKHALN